MSWGRGYSRVRAEGQGREAVQMRTEEAGAGEKGPRHTSAREKGLLENKRPLIC